MRPILRLLTLILTAGVLAATFSATAKDNRPKKLQLTVDLTDGSRLVGTTKVTELPLRSEALGKLEVSLAKVRTIKFSRDHESVTVTLTNGDRLKGGLRDWSLKLRTLLGNMDVPIEFITTISMPPALPAMPGLVLCYDFLAAPSGQLHNVEIVQDDGRGAVARFAGEGSYVSFPDQELPAGNSARTVSLWFQTTRQALRQVLFMYGRHQPGDETHLLIYENNDVVTLGNWGGGGEFRGRQAVTDGRWHHVALVYDGTGTAKVYVDGTLDITAQRTYETTTGGTGYLSFDYPQHGFRGLLDDFMVFDRALCAEEVTALYQTKQP